MFHHYNENVQDSEPINEDGLLLTVHKKNIDQVE